MQTQTIAQFLDSLAARAPVPGGGASAALHVAQGAALVCMVGRYSDGPKYAEHAELIERCVRAGDVLRHSSLDLAERDAEAFAGVAAAYAAPKQTDAEKAARRAAIAQASAAAARPAIDVVAAAAEVVRLADELLPVANRNLIADIAAAVEAARAGAATARVNVVVNLAGLDDAAAAKELAAAGEAVDDVLRAADRVSAAVLAEVSR